MTELSNWAYKDAVEEIQKIGGQMAETAKNEAPSGYHCITQSGQ